MAARLLTLPNARAALWTARALRSARRQLRAGQWEAIELPPVPPVPAVAERGVQAVLWRSRATCLPRAIVRQRWYAAHGSPRDLVVGVTAPSSGFEAHAWLEGDPPCHTERYRELLRRPAAS